MEYDARPVRSFRRFFGQFCAYWLHRVFLSVGTKWILWTSVDRLGLALMMLGWFLRGMEKDDESFFGDLMSKKESICLNT